MRKWLILFLCCMLALPAHAAENVLQFTDDAGRNVTLYQTPKRVAVLFSSFAQMWQDAGGDIAITVGETVERGFAADDALLVDAGAGKSINVELLIAYQPDFVIASADIPAQVEAADVLDKMGVPVALFKVDSFEEYAAAFRIMTQITGNEMAYEEKVVQVREQISRVLADVQLQAKGKRILFIRAGSSASATKAKQAQDHFACAMLQEMGCVNIADDAPVLLDGLSMESILAADPDMIFFSLMGSEESALRHVEQMLSQSTWGQLRAVREKRAYILPRELFHFKPNAAWGQAYEYLAGILMEE